MDARRKPVAGIAYTRLVPASLLPPEDPSSGARTRTMRDAAIDVLIIAVSAGVALLFLLGTMKSSTVERPGRVLARIDIGASIVSLVLLWWRRRWPVAITIVTSVLSVVSVGATAVSTAAVFTVAVHRRTSVAIAMGVVNLAAALIYPVVRPQYLSFWLSAAISFGVLAVVIAWGMFVRARRQLVWVLRERAERAEAERQAHVERARTAERTRIAREMHDVLGHRISMMALQAGGLAIRPDLPVSEVADTAELLRSSAQGALEELRSVIGVLRGDSTELPSVPQPTLRDLQQLVDTTRRAGADVEFTLSVPPGVEPAGSIGRDAYRIVQEALTNVSKHAGGGAAIVAVSGAPGDGLRICVRNRIPARAASSLPGAGSGLLGLRERVTLTGGTLEHGPTGDGEFVVDARLSW